MTEREWTIDYLVNGLPGLSPEEAELRMRDDDLWILIPEQRFACEGEEDVRQWEAAAAFAGRLNEGIVEMAGPDGNEAIVHLVWDLRARANEALRRAKERAS